MSELKTEEDLAQMNMQPTPAMIERPTMRSIALGSSGTPKLQRPASFGKAPPLGIQRPRSVGSNKDTSISLKKVWDGQSAVWNVNKHNLEVVPEGFPLERTSRFIHDVEAEEVARRISVALKMNSIQAEFKSSPPNAKCKTQDLVSFRIRLYAADESHSPIVVEVQRRSGPTSFFMQACRAVLNAAEGKEMTGVKQTIPLKPLTSMKCLEGIAVVSDDEDDWCFAFENAVSLIRHKNRDTNILGLEALKALTDPLKTRVSTAKNIASKIVKGGDSVDIREDLFSMIERDSFSTPSDDIALARHEDTLRQVALTIFANSFQLLVRNITEYTSDAWFCENLVPCLVGEVKRSTSDACCAVQAITCVTCLLKSLPAKQAMVTHGIVEAVEESYEFGKQCNDLLAEESTRCLDLLSASCI